MIYPTYDTLEAMARDRKYKWFTATYDLNLIGIRNDAIIPDRFDDTFVVAYKDTQGNKRVFYCPITTDPGLHWLKKPMNPDGTAILAPGQHLGIWQKGLHRGKYTALVQRKPAYVIRDNNKDAVLNFDSKKVVSGIYGINLHRASETTIVASVGQYSAGCQVIPVIEDFLYVMNLIALQGKYLGSTIASYTLYMETELDALA